METDWRHRFTNGFMRWTGSVARTDFIGQDGNEKGYQWRGHLFGTTEFDLSDTGGPERTWPSLRIKFTCRVTNLVRRLAVNRAYAERFTGRICRWEHVLYSRHAARRSLTEPFVAPEIRYSAFGEPNQTLGGRWSMNAGLLVTTREGNVKPDEQGPNTRRLSFDAGWERQIASRTGFLTNISALARADGYWADNVPDPDSSLGTGFTKVQRIRPFAQANVKVSYPLGRRGSGYRQVLEPIALLSAAPRVKRSTLLPNEDSLDVEFDETNIFATNRFTGVDRIEGGTRLSYGLRHILIGDGGERLEMLGGQVLRTRKDLSFPEASGLAEELSDYVGRVSVSPARWFDATYGFKLARSDLQFARQQFSAPAGVPIFRPSVKYLLSRQTETSSNEVEKLEEASFSLSSRFLKYWSLSASHSHAFAPSPGARTTSLGLSYADECFEAALTGERAHPGRPDVDSGTTVMFRFFMKNIGGWESNQISAGTM
jgi:LPS-assembly protein